VRSAASRHVISGNTERFAVKFRIVPPLLNVMRNVFACTHVRYIIHTLREAETKASLFSL
jgi:hypothetical protein